MICDGFQCERRYQNTFIFNVAVVSDSAQDVVTEEILRLGKAFPSLVKTLITERDM